MITENQEQDQEQNPSPSLETLEPCLKRMRDAVLGLPMENRNTLQYVMSHLSRLVNAVIISMFTLEWLNVDNDDVYATVFHFPRIFESNVLGATL